jgi:hypothetical protein
MTTLKDKGEEMMKIPVIWLSVNFTTLSITQFISSTSAMFGLTRPGEKRKAQSNQTWFSYVSQLNDKDILNNLDLNPTI